MPSKEGPVASAAATASTTPSPSCVPVHPLPGPAPDDVLQGPKQRLLLVLDAMLGAQRLHQWGDLVEVVPGHGGEEAGGMGQTMRTHRGAGPRETPSTRCGAGTWGHTWVLDVCGQG